MECGRDEHTGGKVYVRVPLRACVCKDGQGESFGDVDGRERMMMTSDVTRCRR